MLEEIRNKAAALIAERDRLIEEKERLHAELSHLKNQLAERDARLAEFESRPEPQPQPVSSNDAQIGERIRALVEEIDACIALMPHSRDMATAELLSA